MKILIFCLSNPDGVAYHRLITPHKKLERDYKEVTCDFRENIEGITWGDLEQYDIILYSRLLASRENVSEFFTTIKEWVRVKNLKTKIVADVDDFWELPPSHPLHGKYIQGRIEVLQRVHIHLSDYIITTNPMLESEIKPINSNTIVLPNSIDKDDPQFSKVKTESSKIRFGYVGGGTHYDDLKILQPHFEWLNRNYKGKYELVFCGAGKTEISKKMEKIFRKGSKNFTKLKAKPVTQYGEFYKNIDVSLVPLRDSKFNSLKSNLKVSEAFATGTIPLCSNVEPYKGDLLAHGIEMVGNGQWSSVMEQIIKHGINKPFWQEKEKLWEKNFDIGEINKKRLEFYKTIISK